MSRTVQPTGGGGINYDVLCALSASDTARGLSPFKDSPVTWLDLAVDYALCMERIIRGDKALKLNAEETAEAIRLYCGEEAYSHLPTGRELSSAIRYHEKLSRAYRRP